MMFFLEVKLSNEFKKIAERCLQNQNSQKTSEIPKLGIAKELINILNTLHQILMGEKILNIILCSFNSRLVFFKL
jgi:hypothetical protein